MCSQKGLEAVAFVAGRKTVEADHVLPDMRVDPELRFHPGIRQCVVGRERDEGPISEATDIHDHLVRLLLHDGAFEPGYHRRPLLAAAFIIWWRQASA